MISRATKIFSIFLISCLLILVSCDGGSKFKGSVRDSTGHPVPGAKIIFETPPGKIRTESETSTDGTFSTFFLHSPYGKVRINVIVSKPGYKNWAKEVSAGDYNDFQVVLERDATSESK
jgi:hypothetical protein